MTIMINRFVDGQRANGFDRDFFVISNISQSYHMAIVKCEVLYVYWVFVCMQHLNLETILELETIFFLNINWNLM